MALFSDAIVKAAWVETEKVQPKKPGDPWLLKVVIYDERGTDADLKDKVIFVVTIRSETEPQIGGIDFT